MPAVLVLALLAQAGPGSNVAPQEPPTSGQRGPEWVASYVADHDALLRVYDVPAWPRRYERMRAFGEGWLERMELLDREDRPLQERLDWLLLRDRIRRDLDLEALERRRFEEVQPFLGFADPLVTLVADLRLRKPAAAEEAARVLARAAEEIVKEREDLREAGTKAAPAVADRAARTCERLRRELEGWYRFHADSDPVFTWWVDAPYRKVRKALADQADFLRRDVGGLDPDDEDALVGDPIGRDALMRELAAERIAYSPEELVQIGERELAWCQERMREAAEEMGYGDDWRAALDHVKEDHVPPGEQPRLIVELAEEAVRFLDEHELVTIPPLARETWRIRMMTTEQQRFTPYFTGGEVISIAYPTREMEYEDKLMSLRGNNVHFSRATVHHELIPGHHLQGFMARRFLPHRRAFHSPFLVEGWALYWELLLWDLGFVDTPEGRLGMLFWRAHRAARIVFSMRYHLGEWTGEECVDFLVREAAREPRNARAEVRRSIAGGYPPLYQCAYLVGGLQLRALHDRLVGREGWSERRFHDAVLRQGPVPIAFVRAALSGEEPPLDGPGDWRFYPLD